MEQAVPLRDVAGAPHSRDEPGHGLAESDRCRPRAQGRISRTKQVDTLSCTALYLPVALMARNPESVSSADELECLRQICF
jgi:hypothetical protein